MKMWLVRMQNFVPFYRECCYPLEVSSLGRGKGQNKNVGSPGFRLFPPFPLPTLS